MTVNSLESAKKALAALIEEYVKRGPRGLAPSNTQNT